MKTRDFSFELPERLIAQHPAESRDQARLLLLRSTDGSLEDHAVTDLPGLLPDNSLVVFNDSRVEPVRLPARKQPDGGAVELLLVEPFTGTHCRAMIQRARRVQVGAGFRLPEDVIATVIAKAPPFVELELNPGLSVEYLRRHGSVPLPPYIRREANAEDLDRYQTVYAADSGSAAAPTAGLHFTPELLAQMRAAGHETAFVTLHVGPGTFLPVRTERAEDHQMHSERYSISGETSAAIQRARSAQRTIVAVGTTTVRTLESAARARPSEPLAVGTGETQLFIYPGFRFQVVDALFTNFHTPESSLMMLVAAFTGYESVMRAYRYAVSREYRFFSYGDAMLIL